MRGGNASEPGPHSLPAPLAPLPLHSFPRFSFHRFLPHSVPSTCPPHPCPSPAVPPLPCPQPPIYSSSPLRSIPSILPALIPSLPPSFAPSPSQPSTLTTFKRNNGRLASSMFSLWEKTRKVRRCDFESSIWRNNVETKSPVNRRMSSACVLLAQTLDSPGRPIAYTIKVLKN